MSMILVSGDSEYIHAGEAILTEAPFTMSCWVKPADVDANQTLMTLGDTGGGVNFHTLYLAITTGKLVTGSVETGPVVGSATTGNAVTPGKWHHACGVWASATDRKSYLDAGTAATDSTDVTPAGIDETAIGARIIDTPAIFLNGEIFWAGIWNVALTAKEVADLARGKSPLGVRSTNLVSCLRLKDDILDRSSGITWSIEGTPTFDKSPIIASERRFQHRRRRRYMSSHTIFGREMLAYRRAHYG